MLKSLEDFKKGRYGFSPIARLPKGTCSLKGVGWTIEDKPTYYWDGLKRKDRNVSIFQYTLSGKGLLEFRGKKYIVSNGHAFIVKVPSKHVYRLPDDWDPWEFIYIVVSGNNAIEHCEKIIQNFGPIIKLDPEDSPIRILIDIYKTVSKGEPPDSFTASIMVYQFVMELYKFCYGVRRLKGYQDKSMDRVIEYISLNYHKMSLGIEAIARASGFSRYHLMRLFHTKTGLTVNQYLTKIRLQKAVTLLKKGDLTIDEVAHMVGYSGSNYFCKVFRKVLGFSPGNFKSGKIPYEYRDIRIA